MVATPHSPDATIPYNALRHDEAVFAALLHGVENALKGTSQAVWIGIAANLIVKAMKTTPKPTRKKMLRALAVELEVTL